MASRSIAAETALRKADPVPNAAARRVTEVECQEAVFEPGARVLQRVAAPRAFRVQNRVFLARDPADDVGFPGLEAHHLQVLDSGKCECQFRQVGQAGSAGIGLPVVGIALQNDALARHELLQPEWAKPGNRRRRRAKGPDLVQLPFAIRAFQQVAWEHRDAVENPLPDRIDPRQYEDHPVGSSLRTVIGLPSRSQKLRCGELICSSRKT